MINNIDMLSDLLSSLSTRVDRFTLHKRAAYWFYVGREYGCDETMMRLIINSATEEGKDLHVWLSENVAAIDYRRDLYLAVGDEDIEAKIANPVIDRAIGIAIRSELETMV